MTIAGDAAGSWYAQRGIRCAVKMLLVGQGKSKEYDGIFLSLRFKSNGNG